MADLFLTSPGRVAAIDGPGVSMNLFLETWGGFAGFKSIITGIKGHEQVSIQFLHTLRDFIYCYLFGNRIVPLEISGLSFWQRCDNEPHHGIEYVNSYFLQNMASQRATPITVVVGLSMTLVGFLTDFDFNYSDSEHQICQFQLKLHCVPEASDLG